MKISFYISIPVLLLTACTSVKDGSSHGGVIWEHFSDKSYSKVVRLANDHCKAFGKEAEIIDKKINGFIESEYDEYKFRCVDVQKSNYTNTPSPWPPVNPAPQNLSPSKITLDEAKQKCATLGFKVGTELFGSCVLKLSR